MKNTSCEDGIQLKANKKFITTTKNLGADENIQSITQLYINEKRMSRQGERGRG